MASPVGAESEQPKGKPSRVKVRAHRERLCRQGLRPIQIWVPDVRSPSFKAKAHRQSLAADYAGKLRPAAILQDDRFDTTGSITSVPSPPIRPMPPLPAGDEAERDQRIAKSVPLDGGQDHHRAEGETRRPSGRLDDKDIVRLNRAVLVYLGMAGAAS